MTTRDLLTRARARIAKREHWCKGAYAATKDGYETEPWLEEAQQWCAVGTVMAGTKSEIATRRAFKRLVKCLPTGYGGQIWRFNDDWRRTHEEVLALFDCAIAQLGPAERK